MRVTAIIVDDEVKSIAILKSKIERFCPEVAILKTTESPEEGIKLIEKLNPQIVFLDVAMPVMSGFDLLANIREPNFEIIFVTAFDNYALDAIQHCAIGYVVKPVDNERLVEAVNRAKKNIDQKTALEKNKQFVNNMSIVQFAEKNIAVPTRDGFRFVKINHILYCEGKDGYTKLHLNIGKSILSSYNIGYYKNLLNNQSFYLTHKSYLVNLEHVIFYTNDGHVRLSNQKEIPVSRNRRVEFIKFFKGNQ